MTKARASMTYPLTDFALWLDAEGLSQATVHHYVALVRSVLSALSYDPEDGRPINAAAVADYYSGLAFNSRRLSLSAWRRYADYCRTHGADVPVPARGRSGRISTTELLLPPAVARAVCRLHAILACNFKGYRPESIVSMTWGHVDDSEIGTYYVSVPGCTGEYSNAAFYSIIAVLRSWAFAADEQVDKSRPLVPGSRGSNEPLTVGVLLSVLGLA